MYIIGIQQQYSPTIRTCGTYEESSDTDLGISFEVPKKRLKLKVK